MDAESASPASHVLVVVGKGGVGKTTVAAALSVAAARAGRRVLLASLDAQDGTAALFGSGEVLRYEEVVLAPRLDEPGAAFDELPGEVRARLLTSDRALLEYLEGHGLGRVIKRLTQHGALEVVSSAIPGISEVLVLGKLRQLEESGEADLIVLDAPASGHAVSLLTSSKGLLDAARGGPLRAQAEQVIAMLQDPRRCQVLLVTIPEETPVNEAVETAYRLEEEVGVYLGPIVVNACYEPLGDVDLDAARAQLAAMTSLGEHARRELLEAAQFRLARERLQREQLERLGQSLALDQVRLPFIFETVIGPTQLSVLAERLGGLVPAEK